MDRITLLAADDEPIVHAFLQRYVRENDLPVSQVYEAANGQEAIDLALKHSPDLALLDIRMPGVNGLDAAAAILKHRPETIVVLVTAYDDFEYARCALRSGVSDYLLKPLDPAALTAQVENARAAKSARLARAEEGDGALFGRGEMAHPLVEAVRVYVDGHLGEDLRLETVARAAHTSPSHCSRMFSRYAGMAVSDFIARRREEKAREMLSGSYLSVTEIAGNLGFSSSTYFANWFKRRTGVSPLQYRKDGEKGSPGLGRKTIARKKGVFHGNS